MELEATNLQALASSAAPVQIGLQVGVTFERAYNTLCFDVSRNYLKLLNSSSREALLIYDIATQRAWLVPLLSIMHHMAWVYCPDIPIQKGPFADPHATSGQASFGALRTSGHFAIESGGEDTVTLRELIVSFLHQLRNDVFSQAPQQ